MIELGRRRYSATPLLYTTCSVYHQQYHMQVYLTLAALLVVSAVGVSTAQILPLGTWVPAIGFMACMMLLLNTSNQPSKLNKRQVMTPKQFKFNDSENVPSNCTDHRQQLRERSDSGSPHASGILCIYAPKHLAVTLNVVSHDRKAVHQCNSTSLTSSGHCCSS